MPFILLLNLLAKQSQSVFAFQVVTSRSQLDCLFLTVCSVFNFPIQCKDAFKWWAKCHVMSLWSEMFKWSIIKLTGSSSSFISSPLWVYESSRRRKITFKLEWALRVPPLYTYYWISCLSLTTFYIYCQKKKTLFTFELKK